MKYLSEFREKAPALAIKGRIEALGQTLFRSRKTVRIMEVCGTHTMAIGKYAIRAMLPELVELVSGPGCPVCVTDEGYLDAAIDLARQGAIICTFGDMLKVPGSKTSLAECRSEGGRVEVCFSPLDALTVARQNPEREVVFLAIGFETTAAPVLSIIPYAAKQGLKNLSLLTAFKLVPPALTALASDPGLRIDAFLCPAHVSAIIGAAAYRPFVQEYKVPCVIAGFEPLDILLGLSGILEQLATGRAEVENQYSRVVKESGNVRAQQLLEKYSTVVDAAWRGIGTIPGSGLGLRDEYKQFDTEKKLGIKVKAGKPRPGCRCGEVLKGMIQPPDCVLFGAACSPSKPVGPCMVSSEGTCAAYFRYSSSRGL